MRRERIRVYTEASGPLYFGRIDRVDGDTLYVGRHAVWSPEQRPAVRSTGARPPPSRSTPRPSATRTGCARRRRLDIEDRRVLGFVDEPLDAGGEDHLTDAIVEDITRQRVGEMRQIISTITPDQYELISRDVDGALVIQGGPGTGKTAVGLHRAAWLLYAQPGARARGRAGRRPERDVHPLHRAGAAGARRGRRRAAADRRRWSPSRTARSTRRRELAALEGQRADRGRDAAAAVGPADARGRGDPGRAADGGGDRGRAAGARRGGARAHVQLRGGPRALPRAARRDARVARARAPDSLAGQEEASARSARPREYQQLANRAWPRETPEGLVEKLFKNRARLARVGGRPARPTRRSRCCWRRRRRSSGAT